MVVNCETVSEQTTWALTSTAQRRLPSQSWEGLRANAAQQRTDCRQAPGSGQGAAYEWLDEAVAEGLTYYYWLEDIDVNGNRTTHGPVSATANTPTAVTLDGFTSNMPTISLWGLMALMLTLLMGGWLLRGRVE